MKLAIVGSRSFEDYDAMCSILVPFHITEIISGGARGADRLAERYAQEHDIELTVIPAEWEKSGKAAGPIRNKVMVSMCDGAVCFWDGLSKGTRNTMQLCWKAGKPLMIVRTDLLGGDDG